MVTDPRIQPCQLLKGCLNSVKLYNKVFSSFNSIPVLLRNFEAFFLYCFASLAFTKRGVAFCCLAFSAKKCSDMFMIKLDPSFKTLAMKVLPNQC